MQLKLKKKLDVSLIMTIIDRPENCRQSGKEKKKTTVKGHKVAATLTWWIDKCYMVPSVEASHEGCSYSLCPLVQL